MAELSISPEYLEQLAQILDKAAEQAARAKQETTSIPTEVKSWGPLYPTSSGTYIEVERRRHSAVGHVQSLCVELAAQLRAAGEAYTSTDALVGENFDKQVLDY